MRLVSKERKLHISHLFDFVSAYARTDELQKQLQQDIRDALAKAKETRQSQYVNMDGEMFFQVHPFGSISLCLEWQKFDLIEED